MPRAEPRRVALLWCATVVALLPTRAGVADAYARPELLIEVAALRTELAGRPLRRHAVNLDADAGAGPWVLVDVRPLAEYRRGTIGDARHVDIAEWAAAFREGTDAREWTERIGRVAPEARRATVVAFDSAVTPSAARVWWILKYWGFEDVRVLNGGLKAWEAAGGQRSMPNKFHAIAPRREYEPEPSRLATIDDIRRQITNDAAALPLIDARSEAECNAGVIPTAAKLDWRELVDGATGKFKSPEELRALLEPVGFAAERPATVYCRSGGRSAVLALAMELMGAGPVANYYGSWLEWSATPDAPLQLANPPVALPGAPL